MGVQISLKAVLPLAERIVTALDHPSKAWPRGGKAGLVSILLLNQLNVCLWADVMMDIVIIDKDMASVICHVCCILSKSNVE